MTQNSTRRTALKVGVLSVGFTASTVAAHAAPLPPGVYSPSNRRPATNRYNRRVPTPIVLENTAVEANFRSVKLELIGTGDPQRVQYENSSDTVTMVNMPNKLVIRNNGNQTIAAGTTIELSARRLRASGLLEKDTRAFVTRAGSSGDRLAMRGTRVEGDTSFLSLAFNLPSGKASTVAVDWKAHASVNKAKYAQVQFVASCVLDATIDNFVQAQSAEVVAVRL
ncbi:hypothetical protein [Rothia sp. ZJ932]|uniref:hypothetical protein n=1 Tax=Rothia sp. ZJ932 TaxID=2810516 RepID=UPI001967D035|nr:hypothetical protein [Rothia sp. ZJ932]QRZ60961.1 hypothetical protein JR346_06740 [Rothia sp. ZJ932]